MAWSLKPARNWATMRPTKVRLVSDPAGWKAMRAVSARAASVAPVGTIPIRPGPDRRVSGCPLWTRLVCPARCRVNAVDDLQVTYADAAFLDRHGGPRPKVSTARQPLVKQQFHGAP